MDFAHKDAIEPVVGRKLNVEKKIVVLLGQAVPGVGNNVLESAVVAKRQSKISRGQI